MKKKTVLLLVIILILAAGAVYVNREVSNYKKEVNYQIDILKGDIKALDGVELGTTLGIDRKMYWETDLAFENEELIEKDVKLSMGSQPDEEDTENIIYPYVYDSITSSIDEDLSSYFEYGIYWEDGIKEAGDKVISSGKNSFDIKISDYLEYYPLSGEINFETGDEDYDDTYDIREEPTLYYEEGDEPLKKKVGGKAHYIDEMNSFRRFFKIPVLENEIYTVESEDGDVLGEKEVYVDGTEDYFTLNFDMEYVSDKVFLFFGNRSANGKVVDTSEIPGGYGIYAFDVKTTDNDIKSIISADMDSLRNILPLDESTIILTMFPDSDYKHLNIYTCEEDNIILRVMDTDTLKITDRITVLKDFNVNPYLASYLDEENGGYYQLVFTAEDIGINDDELSLAVNPAKGFSLVRSSNGKAKIELEGKFKKDDNPLVLDTKWSDITHTKVNWNGSTLTIASLKKCITESEDASERNNIFIYVYSAEKLECLGKISNDLNQAFERLSYYSHDYDMFDLTGDVDEDSIINRYISYDRLYDEDGQIKCNIDYLNKVH
ncbi:MAG: hypothetical protein IIU36_05325 [Firmicutes bacterium]|nr:hypothetical protein [Bacillota bacterium]